MTAIAEAHPERRHILEEALQGYKLKMYHSCVLLILSQADGLVESDLFTSYRKKKLLKTSEWINFSICNTVTGNAHH